MMGTVAENLAQIRERIDAAAKRAGRTDAITLVAVSKFHDLDAITQAIEAGQKDFGENYVQEAVAKIDAIARPDIRWHFIGHLQKNKAKFVAPVFSSVQTVDSAKLAAALGKKAIEAGRELPILLQVNISGEESKSGADPDSARRLLEEMASVEGVRIRGLMTMPPFLEPEQVRPYFVALRKLRDQLAKSAPSGVSLDELSMGMSGDFEVAIEEGATIVRVGTSIFGERPKAV